MDQVNEVVELVKDVEAALACGSRFLADLERDYA